MLINGDHPLRQMDLGTENSVITCHLRHLNYSGGILEFGLKALNGALF